MLSLNANFLRQKGFDVTEASDGETAWALAGMGGFDLLLLDVMMPGMSGWEVCKRVKQTPATKDTAVVMLTGMGETLNDMNSPLFSADSWLDKPFDFSELERKIRETLALYGKRSPDEAGRPPTYDDVANPNSPIFEEEEDDDDFDDTAETQRPPPKGRLEPFSLKVSGAALPGAKKAAPKKAPAKTKSVAKKPAAKKPAAKPAAKKPAAKKPAAKKPAAKKPAGKKPAPKKAVAKKTPAAKKAAPKSKATPKKAPPKKAVAKKAPAKKRGKQ